MLAEQQLPDMPDLISELNKRWIDFFGAIFPGLIYGSEKHHTGAIIRALPVIKKPILIEGISRNEMGIESLLQPFRHLSNKSATALIVLDSLSSNISSFLSSIFNILADSVEYIGCGAGFPGYGITTLYFHSRRCF